MDVTWQSDSDRVGRRGLLLGGGPIGRATLASRVRIRSRNRRIQVAAVVEAYVALSGTWNGYRWVAVPIGTGHLIGHDNFRGDEEPTSSPNESYLGGGVGGSRALTARCIMLTLWWDRAGSLNPVPVRGTGVAAFERGRVCGADSSTDSLASAHPPRLMRSFSKSKSKDLSFPFPAGAMSLAPDFLLLFLVPVVAAAFRRPH
ncbi:hypothetical protein B296_00010439 [Ensete ventricosum]|uniref:Uncharacterized protein n=1 Tax=Ensete ventricosum TaxID=4639 RepID=A0A426YHY2_ENSVE|nr:hypothetical protein B296_00010439 [Ensete ventricosum]